MEALGQLQKIEGMLYSAGILICSASDKMAKLDVNFERKNKIHAISLKILDGVNNLRNLNEN